MNNKALTIHKNKRKGNAPRNRFLGFESFQETKKVKKSFKVLSTGIQCMRGV